MMLLSEGGNLSSTIRASFRKYHNVTDRNCKTMSRYLLADS